MDVPHDRPGTPPAGGGRPRGRGRLIREDSIALLHRGNRVIATSPVDATDALEAGDPEGEVHYHFPVEVEVRALPEAMDPDEIVERALERLTRALESG